VTPPSYTYEQIARNARMYHTNSMAAEAMGIKPGSFLRICKRLGIESPGQRRERERDGELCESSTLILTANWR
jgi:hypothetical protein